MNSPVIANAVNRLVIANAVKQSMTPDPMDCRVAGAPRNDGLFLSMNRLVIANAVNRLVIANAVKQSMTPDCMDCRVAGAPRNDGLFLFMNRLVIANAVKQSMTPDCMDCRVTTFLAMTATFTMTSLFMESPSTLRQAQDRSSSGQAEARQSMPPKIHKPCLTPSPLPPCPAC